MATGPTAGPQPLISVSSNEPSARGRFIFTLMRVCPASRRTKSQGTPAASTPSTSAVPVVPAMNPEAHASWPKRCSMVATFTPLPP